MFGRKKNTGDDRHDETAEADTGDLEAQGGPYDYEDVAERITALADQRLDLGSVILPVPEGGQLQVEMAQDGSLQGVHLVVPPHGRLTIAAYAAPKSPGQWREVVGDLSDSLRTDDAEVTIENGPWGRELVASTAGADLRFIGVDGYRWMIRLVAAGERGSTAEGAALVRIARGVLRDTVVRRGTDPHPVRTPLPVVLPPELAQQVVAAQQQAVQQATVDAATQQVASQTAEPQRQRHGAEGSAMQRAGLDQAR